METDEDMPTFANVEALQSYLKNSRYRKFHVAFENEPGAMFLLLPYVKEWRVVEREPGRGDISQRFFRNFGDAAKGLLRIIDMSAP